METDEIGNAVFDVAATGIEIIYEQWARLEDEYGTEAVLAEIDTYHEFRFDPEDYRLWRDENDFEEIQ